jgi:hypothetical protein
VADSVDAGPAEESRKSVASSVERERSAVTRSVTSIVIASNGECPDIVSATGNHATVSVCDMH